MLLSILNEGHKYFIGTEIKCASWNLYVRIARERAKEALNTRG